MQKKPLIIGAVGGVKIPPVDHFIAGYQAGAKAANPKAKVLVGYSQSFTDQGKCKELALNQIAQGSQAEFAVAGSCGLGALSAAKDKGLWGIGVDADQAYLGGHMLTSAVKRVDVGVLRTIKQAKTGTFRGFGNTIFSVRAGGVGLGQRRIANHARPSRRVGHDRAGVAYRRSDNAAPADAIAHVVRGSAAS